MKMEKYYILVVIASCFMLFGCSSPPTIEIAEEQLREGINFVGCSDYVSIENIKKVNGQQVTDDVYKLTCSYELVAIKDISFNGRESKCSSIFSQLPMPAESFAAGYRQEVQRSFTFQKTENGWK